MFNFLSKLHHFIKDGSNSKDIHQDQTPNEYHIDLSNHHLVLAYIKGLESGNPSDEKFESLSLNHSLGFSSLNVAELLMSAAKSYDVPIERVQHFLRVGITDGGDPKLALLLERLKGLEEAGFSENERFLLLESGLIADRQEILPILPKLDNVGFLVKLYRFTKRLKDLSGHDAIDARFEEVENDPGWDQ